MISMGKEGTKPSLSDSFSKTVGSFAAHTVQGDQWLVMEVEEDVSYSGSATSSSQEDSTTSSITSSSSSDFTEDASSSTSSSSSPPQSSNGPLFELSELMAQLPIKRGLSKHYQGKSQSFTSLSSVRCLDDFAKREAPCKKKMKTCKSYGGGLDTRKSCTPKAVISKKPSRGSASLIGKRRSFMGSSCRPPLPVQKNQCI
ncbi:cell wall integrity and stress response component 1-like [Macadamia integrifolia]|uniref:cell wall integrity and stress response component 1-like n=1 Tax=Macadamia integrifolia TaxID=60698 RepID=UPI001C4EEF4F|nr:cell wall integrity and stress response component 1-like [Macadamia integrifolia]